MKLQALAEIPPWEWPGDTRARLVEVLCDADAAHADRVLAAELAGDFTVINDQAAETLLAIATNPDEAEEVRSRAAISLGTAMETGDEAEIVEDGEGAAISAATLRRLTDALHALYQDAGAPREVRRRSLEASVRAPRDWHPAAVKAAYRDGDPERRLTAVFCMGWIRGFDRQILEALGSEDPELRREAVVAAGEQEVDEAWEPIAELVSSGDTDKELLLAAIAAAAAIRPREAGPLLVDVDDAGDEEIAATVAEAMDFVLAAQEAPDDFDDDFEDFDEELDDDEPDIVP